MTERNQGELEGICLCFSGIPAVIPQLLFALFLFSSILPIKLTRYRFDLSAPRIPGTPGMCLSLVNSAAMMGFVSYLINLPVKTFTGLKESEFPDHVSLWLSLHPGGATIIPFICHQFSMLIDSNYTVGRRLLVVYFRRKLRRQCGPGMKETGVSHNLTLCRK